MGTEMTKLKPLGLAASDLSHLCDILDDGRTLDDAFVELFGEEKLAVQEAVARRINFLHALEGGIAQAEQMYREWRGRKEKLEAALERIKERTKQVLIDNPGIPYKSESGEIKVVNNGGLKAMTLEVPTTKMTYSNIPVDMSYWREAVKKYTKRDVIEYLDTAAIRKDLEGGALLPWAKLEERGTRIKYGW